MESLKNTADKALRASERIFKTDMAYVVRGGFWLTIGQVLSACLSFALAVAFARLLSKDAYGTYKFIFSIAGIIGAFSLTGLNGSITNAIAHGKDGTLAYSFKKNLLWSWPMLAIFLGTSAYYYTHGNTTLGISLLIIGILSPFLSSAGLADAFLVGKRDFRMSTLTSVGALFLTSAATLAAIIYTENIVVIVTANIVASTLAELAVYWFVERKRVLNAEVDDETVRYGAHLSAMGIFNSLVDRIDSILAFHFVGAAPLAVYSFAIAIPEQIKGLLKNIQPLAIPKFTVQDDSEHIRRAIIKKMILLTCALVVVIGIYIGFAPLIYKIFFPQYADTAVTLSRIYALSLIFSASIIPQSFLQAKSLTRELYHYNIVSGTVQMILMAIGVIHLGILGLVLAVCGGRLFRFGYAWVILGLKRNA